VGTGGGIRIDGVRRVLSTFTKLLLVGELENEKILHDSCNVLTLKKYIYVILGFVWRDAV